MANSLLMPKQTRRGLGGCGGTNGFWAWNGFNQRRRKKNNSSSDRRNQRNYGSSYSVEFIHVLGCIIVGIIGLIIDIPLFTAIAVVKSPYLLFKGWYRLAQDAINREGPFLEIACIPVAGLTILFWPIIVIGFVLTTIFSSIFVGLYGAIVVFQEKSFN